jgi:hypothetical protein
MKPEISNFNTPQPADDSPVIGGEDAAMPAETTDVVEEKKPINRGAVLLAVMLAGAATLYFVFMRPSPKPAQGAADALPQAEVTINQFLSEGHHNVDLMRQMLAETRRIVQQFVSYPNAVQVPLSGLASNPFSYASGGASEQAPEHARREADDDHQALLKAAQGLQLQTIMRGQTNRSCIINNKLYQEGQVVEDFTIEKIKANSVIVRRGGSRFELRIER